jgi:DMSO reductase anchor subunit
MPMTEIQTWACYFTYLPLVLVAKILHQVLLDTIYKREKFQHTNMVPFLGLVIMSQIKVPSE